MNDPIEKVFENNEIISEEQKTAELEQKIKDKDFQINELKGLVRHYIEREKQIRRQLVYLSQSIETVLPNVPID